MPFVFEDVGLAKCLMNKLDISPSHVDGLLPDTPHQLLHWTIKQDGGHVSKIVDDNPVTYHYINNKRIYDPTIPKILHVFDNKCVSDNINKDWTIMFWNHSNVKKIKFESKYSSGLFAKHVCKHKGRQCYNIVLKLEMLYLYGGVFVNNCNTLIHTNNYEMLGIFHDTNKVSSIGATKNNMDIYNLLSRLNEYHVVDDNLVSSLLLNNTSGNVLILNNTIF